VAPTNTLGLDAVARTVSVADVPGATLAVNGEGVRLTDAGVGLGAEDPPPPPPPHEDRSSTSSKRIASTGARLAKAIFTLDLAKWVGLQLKA
jgi:hypothetical protein